MLHDIMYSMIRTLKIVISLTLIFALHRVAAWHVLSEPYASEFNNPFSMLWKSAVTGVLSDIWAAALLSLPFWIFEYYPSTRNRRLQKNLGTIWILLIGGLTAAHQGYVEFFKFQIIPFHLTYMTDTAFISASGTTMFGPTSWYILALSAALAVWLQRGSVIRKKRALSLRLMSVIVLALVGHALNIRFRVNWFIVEPLQANYIESLYSNLGKKPTLKPVSAIEKERFALLSGQASLLFPKPSADSYLSLIQTEVLRLRKTPGPIIIGLILSESLRDTDTGKRAQDNRSITPNIDRLQSSGVRFTHVYSSGPVTRGGQEATWCGTPSATDTSLMRSFPDVSIKCLPTLYRGSKGVRTIWLHGGDQQFDSQLAFWTRQGVSQLVTRTDYPSGTPSTGWGISDLALFDKSAAILSELSEIGGVTTLMPMVLSVTNHIPWTVPSDASVETKQSITEHPAHKTIKYFDESLDLFVRRLKEKNLWERAIFVVAGDHGNLEMPWEDHYKNDPMKWERLLSHVSVTVTGGIIEKLRAEGELPAVIGEFTAQNQIAPFLASFAEVDAVSGEKNPLPDVSVFMDAPLFVKSPWTVTSDLNQYLFLPEAGLKLPKEKVLGGLVPETPDPSWLSATRYRAWLEFLYSGASPL
jgi:Sulfatase